MRPLTGVSMDEPLPVFDNRSIHLALSRWHNLDALAHHPLTRLLIVDDFLWRHHLGHTDIDRALALRDLLISAVDMLRPNRGTPDPRDSSWHRHWVMTQRYLELERLSEIAVQMKVEERKARRVRARSLHEVGWTLRLWEQAAWPLGLLGLNRASDSPPVNPSLYLL
jgi:hypothetical protein